MLFNRPRVERVMDEHGMDALLATTAQTVFYFSDMWIRALVDSPWEAQVYLIAPRAALDQTRIVIGNGSADMTYLCDPKPVEVYTYGTFYRHIPDGTELNDEERHVWSYTVDRPSKPNVAEALCAALESAGLTDKTVGLDERGLLPAVRAQVESRYPALKLVPVSHLFRQMKLVKTDEEVRRMMVALRATEAAMMAAADAAHEGVTERELVKVFERTLIDNDTRPNFTLLRFGRGMALGQVTPGDTKLTVGDYIWFDVGGIHRGYRSDIGRVLPLGETNDKQRGYFEACKAGQTVAINMMKPGVRPCDVFDAGVKAVREAGIPQYKRHHIGHSIGIETYDGPSLAPGVETPIEEGMVFEVETPYYEFGFGGGFIEDTVIIRNSGAEIVTTLSRDLQIIGL